MLQSRLPATVSASTAVAAGASDLHLASDAATSAVVSSGDGALSNTLRLLALLLRGHPRNQACHEANRSFWELAW